MKPLEEYSDEECNDMTKEICDAMNKIIPKDTGIHIVIWDTIQVLNMSNVEMIKAEEVVYEFLTKRRRKRIESN